MSDHDDGGEKGTGTLRDRLFDPKLMDEKRMAHRIKAVGMALFAMSTMERYATATCRAKAGGDGGEGKGISFKEYADLNNNLANVHRKMLHVLLCEEESHDDDAEAMIQEAYVGLAMAKAMGANVPIEVVTLPLGEGPDGIN